MKSSAEEGEGGAKLWEHPNPKMTAMYEFKQRISERHGRTFKGEEDKFDSLWAWSVDNIQDFWREVWRFTGIKASRDFDSVGYSFLSSLFVGAIGS